MRLENGGGGAQVMQGLKGTGQFEAERTPPASDRVRCVADSFINGKLMCASSVTHVSVTHVSDGWSGHVFS